MKLNPKSLVVLLPVFVGCQTAPMSSVGTAPVVDYPVTFAVTEDGVALPDLRGRAWIVATGTSGSLVPALLVEAYPRLADDPSLVAVSTVYGRLAGAVSFAVDTSSTGMVGTSTSPSPLGYDVSAMLASGLGPVENLSVEVDAAGNAVITGTAILSDVDGNAVGSADLEIVGPVGSACGSIGSVPSRFEDDARVESFPIEGGTLEIDCAGGGITVTRL